jgi:hypothetical protein
MGTPAPSGAPCGEPINPWCRRDEALGHPSGADRRRSPLQQGDTGFIAEKVVRTHDASPAPRSLSVPSERSGPARLVRVPIRIESDAINLLIQHPREFAPAVRDVLAAGHACVPGTAPPLFHASVGRGVKVFRRVAESGTTPVGSR